EGAFGLKRIVERERTLSVDEQRAPAQMEILELDRAALIAPLRQRMGERAGRERTFQLHREGQLAEGVTETRHARGRLDVAQMERRVKRRILMARGRLRWNFEMGRCAGDRGAMGQADPGE